MRLIHKHEAEEVKTLSSKMAIKKELQMRKEQVKTLYDAKYLRFYEFERQDQGKYYVASRREPDRLPALMTEDEFKKHLPDAVSCFVILNIKGQEKKLLLNREFRYPLGQYMLSVPAGIIDPEDYDKENAIERTAARELYEETGIMIQESDEIAVVNPCVFSTPGMTDEGNALVYISINRDQMPAMTQTGAEGSEVFDGFCILDHQQAQKLLSQGVDDRGFYMPLYTWAALMFYLWVK